MKEAILDNKLLNLTARPDSQLIEVLFFATAHFLFFNFMAAAQVAHFALPLTLKPARRQIKKSHFLQRFNYISFA